MYEYSELVLFIRPRTQTATLIHRDFCRKQNASPVKAHPMQPQQGKH